MPKNKKLTQFELYQFSVSNMVPEAGIEPARYRYRWILSPVRLPVSPLGQRYDFKTFSSISQDSF